MTKPKSIAISAPFDAHHVGGVNVSGTARPMVGIERSGTSLQPDETPSHTYVARGTIEVPQRSHTIATSFSRPSLKLRTSISRLRERSNSISLGAHHRGGSRSASESSNGYPRVEMPVQSLKKNPSTSRSWQRGHHETAVAEQPQKEDTSPSPEDAAPPPIEKDSPVLKLKSSLSRKPSKSTTTTTTPSVSRALPLPPQRPPPPPPPRPEVRPPLPPRVDSHKKLPPVRPTRADSGTAIDFADVPVDERPLGFKEILAVSSFAERMVLYKRTREYWATVDHGLGEWVGRRK